jgi:hypothetical protein
LVVETPVGDKVCDPRQDKTGGSGHTGNVSVNRLYVKMNP